MGYHVFFFCVIPWGKPLQQRILQLTVACCVGYPKPWVSRALPCSELQKCLAGLAGLCRANPNIPTRRYPEIPSHASLVAFLPTCGVCGALRSWVFVVSCESEYLWVLLCICSDPFGKFFERFWTYLCRNAAPLPKFVPSPIQLPLSFSIRSCFACRGHQGTDS
jgi:hypothetical protein